MDALKAFATLHLPVLNDWRTAPVNGRLLAALGYLEKLTLSPKELTVADVQALRDAGIEDAGIKDIAYVCFLFSAMRRIADTLDFEIPTEMQTKATGQFLYKRGNKLTKLIR